MRTGSVGALAVAVMTLLASCGGSDDGDAESATTTSSTIVAPGTTEPPSTTASTTTSTSTASTASATTTTLVAPVPTDAPTTVPTTTTTSTTTTTTTTPPTTVPEAGCLEGSWWLSPEQTTALYATLLPGMPVTVTGTHWVEFTGDTVDYWAVLELRFAVGGIDVTFGLDQHGLGSYTVADNVLAMTYDTFESNIHEGHGTAISNPDQHPETYVDEAVDLADNGDGTITINRITIPVIDIPPVAGGPVGCDATTMSLGFTSGLADSAAVYTRR